MSDEIKLFPIRVESDSPGIADGVSELALKRSKLCSWRPSHSRRSTTVVFTDDGRVHEVKVEFKEFHQWAIGPAAANDKAAAAAKKLIAAPRGTRR